MHLVGTVPTDKKHSVGTLLLDEMHPVGTVPTDNMHPVGTLIYCWYLFMSFNLDCIVKWHPFFNNNNNNNNNKLYLSSDEVHEK